MTFRSAKANGAPPIACTPVATAAYREQKEVCSDGNVSNRKKSIVCITIKCRITCELSPEIEGTIKKIVAGDQRRILFDLGGLDYLRTPTLRVILKAVKPINQKQGKVALCSLNAYVREFFEGNCFEDNFAIADSLESGIQTLQKTLNAA